MAALATREGAMSPGRTSLVLAAVAASAAAQSAALFAETHVAWSPQFYAGRQFIADITGDGLPDRVFANMIYAGNVAEIRPGIRDGLVPQQPTLVAAPSGPPCGSYRIAVGDVDGDGLLDIVATCCGTPSPSMWALTVHRNNGAGQFVFDATATSPGIRCGQQPLLVDVDRDGDLDLFLAAINPSNQLLINNGQGIFVDETPTRLPPPRTLAASVATALDVDNDGDQDILVGNGMALATLPTLYVNDGTGVFTDGIITAAPVPWWWIAVGDIDGNGYLDVFATEYGRSHILLNQQGALFETSVPFPATMNFVTATGILDADGDGDQDLIFARGAAPLGTRLLENLGGFQFRDISHRIQVSQLDATLGLFVGDIDGDGDEDVLEGNNFQTGGRILANTTRQLLIRNDPVRGSAMNVSAFGSAGHVFLHGISLGAVGMSIPPLGWFWLDPNLFTLYRVDHYSQRAELTIPILIPNIAALVGANACVQALDIEIATGDARLTNCPCRVIR
ncbi:MAG: VCBS repeat-containing protein [Planctomycetes bacterium]|nr:VCBS repeat-containing protein [Planctomycetota bacterium]